MTTEGLDRATVTTEGPGRATTFGRREFQFVLLRRMADFQRRARRGGPRAAATSARAEMREANRRWQAMLHAARARSAVGRYRSVLGPPEQAARQQDRRPRVRGADLGAAALARVCASRWSPSRAAGSSTSGWCGPRARGPRTPYGRGPGPWSCTVDEVARAFAPARPMEGSAPSRWRLGFDAPDAAGMPHQVIAEFTWGLLQRLPEDRTWADVPAPAARRRRSAGVENAVP